MGATAAGSAAARRAAAPIPDGAAAACNQRRRPIEANGMSFPRVNNVPETPLDATPGKSQRLSPGRNRGQHSCADSRNVLPAMGDRGGMRRLDHNFVPSDFAQSDIIVLLEAISPLPAR